jgi:hypothetical protein
MSRYLPTPEERAALEAQGWSVDDEGWWMPATECGTGRTYREAVREQGRRDRAALSGRDQGRPRRPLR